MESNDNTANSAHASAPASDTKTSSKTEVPEWPISPTFLSLRKGTIKKGEIEEEISEENANYNTDGIFYTDYLRGFLADLSHDKNVQNALSLFQFVPENFLPHDPNAEDNTIITTEPNKATVILNTPVIREIYEVLKRQHKKIIRIDSGTYVNNGSLCYAFRRCDEINTSFCFMQDSIVGIFADEELNEYDNNSLEYRERLEKLISSYNQERDEKTAIKLAEIKTKKGNRIYIHHTCPISLYEEHAFPIYIHGKIIACLMLGQTARENFDIKKAFLDYRGIMKHKSGGTIEFDEIEITYCKDKNEWGKKVRAIAERLEIFEKRIEDRIDHRNTLYIIQQFGIIEKQFREEIGKIRIKDPSAISKFTQHLNSAFNKIRDYFDNSDTGFFRMFAVPISTIQKELVLVGWSGEISPEEKAGLYFSLKKLKGLDRINDAKIQKQQILSSASQAIRESYNKKDVFWYGALADNDVAYIVWLRYGENLSYYGYSMAFNRYRYALRNFYSVVLECYSYIRGAKMALLLETTYQQSAHESAHFIVPARDMIEKNLNCISDKMINPTYKVIFLKEKKHFDTNKQAVIAMLNQLEEINNGSSLIFSDTLSINKQSQNVHDLLMKLKRMFSSKADDYHKYINYVEEKRFIIAEIDVAYFNHALYNLVENAVKYAFEGSNIYINMDVDRTEGKLMINFKSYGIPIKEEDKEKIYHLFERGEDAALSTKGTGIGMYIVKKVCNAHGGDVWHISEHLSNYNIPVLFNYKHNFSFRKELTLGEHIEYDKLYQKELNRLSGIEKEVVHNHNFVSSIDMFNSRINTPTYRNTFFVSIPIK